MNKVKKEKQLRTLLKPFENKWVALSPARLVNKYGMYTAMFENRIHNEAYKVKHFRVLTVTKSAERASNALQYATREPNKTRKKTDPFIIPQNRRGLFLFTTDLSYNEHPQNVLASVWRKTNTPQELDCFIPSPLPRL